MSILFQPIEIGGMKLKNRFVRSATHDACSNEQGEITDKTIELYSKLAQNDPGLIITGFAYVHRNGQVFAQQTAIDSDDFIPKLKKLADKAHEQDIKIVSNRKFSMQLNHETASDFSRFFSWAIIIIFVLLFILFHNTKKLILAFLPVLAGIVVMFAIMSISGIKLNLFNMVAAVLVIGLAVDYGIFIVCTYAEAANTATCNAVLVSGLTTFTPDDADYFELVAADTNRPANRALGCQDLASAEFSQNRYRGLFFLV